MATGTPVTSLPWQHPPTTSLLTSTHSPALVFLPTTPGFLVSFSRPFVPALPVLVGKQLCALLPLEDTTYHTLHEPLQPRQSSLQYGTNRRS